MRALVLRIFSVHPRSNRGARLLQFSLFLVAFCGVSGLAADLSRYRDFQLGMDLPAAVKQTNIAPSDIKILHRRPAVIQELEWQPQLLLAPSSQPDPVKDVTFRFYNGELYRIVINYDRYKTEGLTSDDFVEVLSTTYGVATRPAATVSIGSLIYADSEKVIARWEDPQYSLSLFRSSYQPSFGLLMVSRRLEGSAQTAIVEAARLDKQEAPQREADGVKMQAQAERAERDKARLANKPNFRP